MTLKEMLAKAEQVDNEGVPVNWRQLCFQVFSRANEVMAEADQKIDKLTHQLSESHERIKNLETMGQRPEQVGRIDPHGG